MSFSRVFFRESFLAGLIVTVAAFLPHASLAQSATPETSIELALENISTLIRSGRIGYATFWDGNKYVQCRRTSKRELNCEAAGSLLQPSLAKILTPERIGRLGAMDWALAAAFGNFVRVFPAAQTNAEIAREILKTLQDGYDADPAALEISTTWVVDMPCPPRNGPSQNLAGFISDSRAMRATALLGCSYIRPAETKMPPVASSSALIERYGAQVSAEIQRLRINATRRVHVIFDAGIGYVQCQPESNAPTLYCEAQSAESWPALASVLTTARIERLHTFGFSDPGRAPNYWKTYPFEKHTDADIAKELLSILFDVYGYSANAALRIRPEN